VHDDDELAASLTGLSGLLSGHRTLEQGLVRVAEFAVRAIPGPTCQAGVRHPGATGVSPCRA